MSAFIASGLVATSGFALRAQTAGHHAWTPAAARAGGALCTMPAPPPGFEWGVGTEEPQFGTTVGPTAGVVRSWYDSGVRLEGAAPAAVVPVAAAEEAAVPVAAAEEEPKFERQAYYCNEQGCWVGSLEELPPVVLPDGRSLSKDAEVGAGGAAAKAKAKPKRKVAQGIFAPAVRGAKTVMGEKELNQLRAQVIAQHTKVISAFVDTSDSPFGQIVLKQMFEAADKDNNGTLDREEIRDALQALGFTFVEDKLLDKIMTRADENGDQVIDFEEFVTETPKTLRMSLVKLAKRNGHDLGFLA